MREAQGPGRSRAGAVGTEVAANETARELQQEARETRDTPAAVSTLTTSCEHKEEEPGCREGGPFQGGVRVLQRQKAPWGPREQLDSDSEVPVGVAESALLPTPGGGRQGRGTLPLRAALVTVLRARWTEQQGC